MVVYMKVTEDPCTSERCTGCERHCAYQKLDTGYLMCVYESWNADHYYIHQIWYMNMCKPPEKSRELML